MLRLLSLFLFFTCSFGSLHVKAAETFRRSVSFEWEPIDGAKYYDIEIRKKTKGSKAALFKTEKAEWNGKLKIGRYEFRLRSLDNRKVPGEWSDYAELDAVIKATDADKQEVKFEWRPTPAATGYSVDIYNDKNELIANEKTSKPKLEYTLPTAAFYSWKVKAISEEGLESESTLVQKFTLMGPKLDKPKIEKPDNDFVREIKWSTVDKAENYDLIVARFNPQIKKWQKFKEFQDQKENSVNFESDWPGGKYKIIVKAKSKGRENSDISAIGFPVREGSRSPATEYVQTMRKSIDRVDGWFSHASWYASSISLKSQYRGTVAFNTNAVTGTGRLGVGLLRSDSLWGFLFIGDAGGYVFENKIYNYFGFEASAVRRQNTSDRAEVRYLMGAFMREFPALYTSANSYISNSQNPSNVQKNYGKGGALGAHGGIEYWYSLTPKLGFQANAHIYIPMTETELPNGGRYSGGDLNYSVGVLGSYRYSSRLTGLMGLNLREENFSYTDSSDSATWGSAIFQGRSTNKVKTTISGIYINLMAEYSF
jgi:hypothetical protein